MCEAGVKGLEGVTPALKIVQLHQHIPTILVLPYYPIYGGRFSTTVVVLRRELLRTFAPAEVVDFAQRLQERMEDLPLPLAWLEESLSPWCKQVDAATESVIVWAWQPA